MSVTLTTDRLTLRKPELRDLDAIVVFYQQERSKFVGGPMGHGPAWRQYAAEVGHWELLGFGLWAVTITATDELVGLVGPWFPGDWPETEIGWLMLEGHEGQGYATEAARAAVDDAYLRLGWDTAVSYIDPLNAASIAVADRLGAVLDPDAPQPKPDHPCLVYRHPKVTAV
ncbi:MAG: GNAT family N-acetyltransferase [Pseudomonadota bacterium]